MGSPFLRKSGLCAGIIKCGKGTKLMAVIGKWDCPIRVFIESALSHEVSLVELTLAARIISDSSCYSPLIKNEHSSAIAAANCLAQRIHY
jgi:hypothetical protein